jgi:hypothetical protein
MNHDRYASNAGSWLIDTARRNPEALLVVAAGCALLMRGGSSWFRAAESRLEEEWEDEDEEPTKGRRHSRKASESEEESEGVLSGVTEQAGEFVSRMAESVSETASAASDYAYETGREFSDNVGRWSGQARSAAGTMLHEQPVAVAVLGLAAGAALAAMLPHTEVEDRALRPARDTIVGVAGTAAEAAKAKAKDFATDRLQEAARSAVDTFTSSLAGDERGRAGHKDKA